MAVTAKFQADFSSFLDAINKAEVELVDFGKGAEKVEKQLNKMVDNFSGRKLIQETTLIATALEQAGGASTLTAKELDRVGAKAAEAAEKMKKLGVDVPPGIQKLADAFHESQKESDSAFVSFGKLVASYVTAQAIIAGLKTAYNIFIGAITQSITAAAEAEKAHNQLVAALKTQGTAVPSVVKAYGEYATALQKTTVFQDDAIESATKMLVLVGNVMPRDMEKALKATTDLASGLGIDLASAATFVGKAAEGNTSALKRSGIVIDETKAKAQGFGFVLDEIEKKFGGQAAAAAATYSGRLQQLSNTWNNVEESIGRVITQNATVLRAFDLINGAIDEQTGELKDNATATTFVSDAVIGLAKAFGFLIGVIDLSQTGITAVVLDLNRMGQAVGNVAALSLEAAKAVAYATGNFKGVAVATAAIEALDQAIDELGERNDAIKKSSFEFGNRLQGVKAQANALAAELEKTRGKTIALAEGTDTAADAWNRQTKAIVEVDKEHGKLAQSLVELAEKLRPVPGQFTLVSAQAKVFGQAAETLVAQADVMGVKVPAAVRQIADAFNRSEINKLMGKVTEQWTKDLDKLNAAVEAKLHATTKIMTDALTAQLGIEKDFQRKLAELSDTNPVSKLAAEWKDALDKLGPPIRGFEAQWQKTVDGIGTYFSAKIAEADMSNAMKAAGLDAARGFSGEFFKVIDDIPKLLNQAFTGGGGLKGASNALGASLGATLGSALSTGSVAQSLSDGLAKLFNVKSAGASGAIARGVGGAITAGTALAGSGAFGQAAQFATAGASIGFMVGGPIGAGIGAAIGGGASLITSAIGKLTGAAEKKINPIRQAFVDMAGGLGELNKKAHEAGVTLDAMLNAKNPQQYEKAINDLNAAFEKQAQHVKSVADGLMTAAAGANALAGSLLKPLAEMQDALGKGDVSSDLTKSIGNVQTSFEHLGQYVAATFAAQIHEGASAFEAFQSLAPSFAALQDGIEKFGLQSTKTIDQLLKIQGVVGANKDVSDSVQALSDIYDGLTQAGYLTKDLFESFAEDISYQFDLLVSRGADGTTALQLMQPELQKLWEGQQKFGEITDESTKALLDQAEKQGLVGEDMKNVNDKILDVLLSIADVFGAKLPKSLQAMVDQTKKAQVEAQKALDAIHAPDITIGVHFNVDPAPDFSGGFEPIAMARGGSGTVDKPTLFLAGEAGREKFAFGDAVDAKAGVAGGNMTPDWARELIDTLRGLPRQFRDGAMGAAI